MRYWIFISFVCLRFLAVVFPVSSLTYRTVPITQTAILLLWGAILTSNVPIWMAHNTFEINNGNKEMWLQFNETNVFSTKDFYFRKQTHIRSLSLESVKNKSSSHFARKALQLESFTLTSHVSSCEMKVEVLRSNNNQQENPAPVVWLLMKYIRQHELWIKTLIKS